jgi:hypothetical protein
MDRQVSMKLIKFPYSTEDRIKSNIERLKLDLWEAETGAHVTDILRICEEYVMGLDEEVETKLALVNIQSSIIFLDHYFTR